MNPAPLRLKMNSLGSSSKWPSYDSLPSTSSFVLSESDQTEDETDFFSEGEGDSGRRKSLSVDEGITYSENYLDFPAHSDQLNLRCKSDQSKHCPEEIKHPNTASSPGAATFVSSSATPGDLAFAQKCADLHRFIRPLLELLHGLKTGRFDKGLTSFQQSVAIDRLQRILGILQKPEMGEKYLQNLLQIEMMLKMWFPQVAFQSIDTPKQTITPQLRPHWCQSQLHMPVKKRKLSWSNPHHAGNVPTKHKHRQQEKHGSCHDSTSFESVSTRLSGSPKKLRTPEEETVGPAGCSCKTGREFTDSTGTLSSPTYLCSKRQKQAEISPPSPHGSPATQDSSVSSSETVTTNDSP
ncbi:circadian associated repressor of transcription a [Seriola aureovittata]|uniref:circadian associated repressor of transcription a n=1 Tax=Seriola aureovittata TaxID=2871759 RepID=UPI0024BE2FE7|nr:circadian associated repressor of transcription a [Seriola aureovittata]